MSIKVFASSLQQTPFGEFSTVAFTNTGKSGDIAIVKGSLKQLSTVKGVLCRVHCACLGGDVLHTARCDCRPQLEAALQAIEKEGIGVIIYSQQEGRGVGLQSKIRAEEFCDEKRVDTIEAYNQLGFPQDARNYENAAAMLKALGVKSVRLLTNNPKKASGLEEYGIKVVERVPLHFAHDKSYEKYYAMKKKMGHVL